MCGTRESGGLAHTDPLRRRGGGHTLDGFYFRGLLTMVIKSKHFTFSFLRDSCMVLSS